MGMNHEQFSWSDEECLKNYVDWNAPACEGITLDLLKKKGFARLNVGCKDTRTPHKMEIFQLRLENASST